MRIHITLDEQLVADLDRRAGARNSSAYVAELIRRRLEDERRADEIDAALGSLADSRHDWDEDPAAWVRGQRQGGERLRKRIEKELI